MVQLREDVSATQEHVEVEATSGIYQRVVESVSHGVPAALMEVSALERGSALGFRNLATTSADHCSMPAA